MGASEVQSHKKLVFRFFQFFNEFTWFSFNLSKNGERPPGVREAALGGIARLLISGRSAPALIVVLVLYILDCEENKEECQKFKVFFS